MIESIEILQLSLQPPLKPTLASAMMVVQWEWPWTWLDRDDRFMDLCSMSCSIGYTETQVVQVEKCWARTNKPKICLLINNQEKYIGNSLPGQSWSQRSTTSTATKFVIPERLFIGKCFDTQNRGLKQQKVKGLKFCTILQANKPVSCSSFYAVVDFCQTLWCSRERSFL